MEILCYGSLNIDYIYHVPHQVLPGETLSSVSLEKNPGGKGANQAAALGKAGCSVRMAGRIGADGSFLLSELMKYGVNTECVRVSGNLTGHAIIQLSDNGENSIILYPGENRRQEECDIDKAFSMMSPGSLLLIQNEISSLDRIIDCARRKDMRTFFNPAPFDSSVLDLPLEYIDTIAVNEIEAAALAGIPADSAYEDILGMLSLRYPAAEILMTAGANGSYYQKGSERHYQMAIPAHAVDTTAAGDTLYWLLHRIKGQRIQHSRINALCSKGRRNRSIQGRSNEVNPIRR